MLPLQYFCFGIKITGDINNVFWIDQGIFRNCRNGQYHHVIIEGRSPIFIELYVDSFYICGQLNFPFFLIHYQFWEWKFHRLCGVGCPGEVD